MRRFVFGLVLLAASGTAVAQQPPPPGLPSPRLQSVFPLGVKAGTSVEVTVTGTDLEEPEKLLFAHPGLKGEYLAPPKDAVPDPKDPKKMVPPPKVNPAGPHKFKVTAAADVPPGLYDLRVVGQWGVSNPRTFAVSDQIEVTEKEPNNDVAEAQKVEIGTTVSGVISSPTDVDYTSFTGKKGQRVVISCLASSIDSKAGPMIEVYDSANRQIATNRGYRENDALVDVVLPDDGEYLVRLFQFTYTVGGPDSFYRLSITAAPWIDAIFPPVVEPGKATPVTIYGRNLPGGQPADGFTADGRPLEKVTVTVTPPADAVGNLTSLGHVDPTTALQDGFSYVLKGPGGSSNPVVIYLARDKLTVKTEPASTPESAAVLNGPGELAGFLAKRGTRDWIAFSATKKGEKFTIDLAAERIGASGDFFFSVRDGKDPKRDLSGEQDDDTDLLHPSGFYTRTSDPGVYTFTAPDEGKYYIVVGCRESSYLSGPKAAYRLRVGSPLPDFRAVAMPYSRFYQTGSAAWLGGTQAYYVFAHRIDGYSGSLEVVAEGLPDGVTADPLTIGPAARWGVLVLNVAADASESTTAFTLKVTGTDSAGKTLVRMARSASVTWGFTQPDQNLPVVAKLDQSLVIAVRAEPAPFTLTADVPNATLKPAMGKEAKVNGPIIVMRQGEKASVPVRAEWSVPEKPNITLTVDAMMANNQNAPVTAQVAGQPTKDKPEVLVNLDTKPNAAPGAYTIVVRGVAQVPFNKDPAAKQKNPVPAEAFANPITVLVVPTAVVKLTPGTLTGNALKIGTPGEILVKVERQYDYTGEIKVKLELPKGTSGITAEDVTIPAGKDEVKLVLAATSDAKPGAVSNAIITATAVYGGKYPIAHEAKVSFTVVAEKK